MISVMASKDNVNLAIGFSTSVIFQMRCADPLKDSGADTTTFSDANLRVILLFYSMVILYISRVFQKDFCIQFHFASVFDFARLAILKPWVLQSTYGTSWVFSTPKVPYCSKFPPLILLC